MTRRKGLLSIVDAKKGGNKITKKKSRREAVGVNVANVIGSTPCDR